MKELACLVALLAIASACAEQITPDAKELLMLLRDPEAQPQINWQSRKSTAQRIAEHGYPVETHVVQTEDGYLITLFRIPYSHKLNNKNEKRPIALVQHGLFSCSDAWVNIGPDDALSFLLADAGFDVWLGNARGNTYSRNHISRSTAHPYFWRFSWHEIGYYDLAAMIDHALKNNPQEHNSIHYVGHSQGTTAFFALLSTRPEYNDKIRTAHMLAPVAFMHNMQDKLVRSLAPYLGHSNAYSAMFGSQEFLPYNDLFMVLAYNACGKEGKILGLCSSIAYMLEGESFGRSNTTAMPYMAETHPAGASTDQILHYMQEQQSGHYRQFDFGTKKNEKVYGTAEPPDYPVHLITALLHLWYSNNDDMAAVEDVEHLAELLPNNVMHFMEDPLWSHGEFATHWEVRKYINDPIIEIMQQYDRDNDL